MDKVWEIKDPDAYFSRRKTVVRKGPPVVEKDPVKAYSLSLICWGAGQFYNDQIAKASVFLITMSLFLVAAVLGATNQDAVLEYVQKSRSSLSGIFLTVEIGIFLMTLIWVVSAGDAYHYALRTRKARFPGVNNKLFPVLGSLLLPGWGQFLNGQQLKGTLYNGLAIVGVFSVLSTVLTYLAWPLLNATDNRFIIEGIFAASVAIIPFVPLLWLFSAYDALRVSLDDLKKEPLWERLKAAYYRGRTQGWVQGIFPQVKGTFLLILLLSFFAVVVYYWFPKEFYTGQLAEVKRVLSDRGMTIVPGMIDRLLAWMGGGIR